MHSSAQRPRALVLVVTLIVALTGVIAPADAGSRQRATNVTAPRVVGDAVVGGSVRCARGTWKGRIVKVRYIWKRDGRPIKGAMKRTYAVTPADAGARLACVVIPRGAQRAASAAVTVTAAPTTSGTPAILGTPRPGETLTCEPGSWSDADRYEYHWKSDGSPTHGAETRPVTATDLGRTLVCSVSAWNNAGGSGRVDSAGVVVTSDGAGVPGPGTPATAVPVNTSVPTVSGDAMPGATLECLPGTWTGATSYAYSWTRDGSPAGAGSTYDVAGADLGATLVCLVVGTNVAGSSGAVPSAGVVVTEDGAPLPPGPSGAPTNTVPPSVTGVRHPGWRLTCDPGEWTGGATLAYSWTRNGSPAGAGPTYLLAAADVGTTIVCLVQGSNSAGASGYLQSPGVGITMPAAPTTAVSSVITGTPEFAETLTCTSNGWTGSPTGFVVSWIRNGTQVATTAVPVDTTSTTPTTSVTGTRNVQYGDIGRELSCRVEASNAGGTGSADSDSVVPYPTNVTPPVVLGSPVVGEELTCDPGTWTVAPQHVVSHAFTWQRDGSDVAGATASTYTATWDDADTDLACTVVLTRLAASSAPVSSQAVRVLPLAPVSTSDPVLTPERGEVGGTLSCDVGTWDNFPTSFVVTWVRGATSLPNPVATTGAPVTRTIVLNDVAKPMACLVTGSNTGGASEATSNTVTPIPSNLVPPSVTGTPEVGQTLTCDPGTWNKAGDFTYGWQRDGADVPGADGASYAAGWDDADADLTCTVVLTHGSGTASDPASSAAVRVLPPVPAPTSQPAISGSVSLGGVLTCTNGTWDNMPSSFTYEWSREGAAIPGATADTYQLAVPDFGYEIVCAVSGTNTGGTGRSTSPPVVLVPYNLTTPSITGTAVVGETLTCASGTWKRGPFIHPATSWTYTWQRDGVDIAGAGATTYQGTNAYTATWDDADTDVTCTVVLTQHHAVSDPATSGVVRVLPKTPVADGVPTVTATGLETGSTLTCTRPAFDNHATTYTYQWFRGGSTAGSPVTTTAASVNRNVVLNDIGDLIGCTVTGTNTGGTSAAVQSNKVAPVATNSVPPTVSGVASVGSTLTCNPGTWNKIGTSNVSWQRKSGGAWAAIAGAAAATYVLTGADESSSVRCREALTKGAGTSPPVASAAVLVDSTGSLLARYDLDGGSIADSLGNTATGTNHGATPTADRFGAAAGALSFGGGSYVQTQQGSNFKPQSFSVWFKAEDIAGTQSIVDSDVCGQFGHNLVIGYGDEDSGRLAVMYHNGSYLSAYVVTPGQWTHATVTYSDRVRLYVDKTLVLDQPYTGSSFDGSDFRFGQHCGGYASYRGAIDDVRFFGSALTATQVGNLY
ncbi:MAG: hypothetical protein CMJ44_04630 [Pimelobacter sp.]|nr:hypothetical protein [Pimelobacter sp.]